MVPNKIDYSANTYRMMMYITQIPVFQGIVEGLQNSRSPLEILALTSVGVGIGVMDLRIERMFRNIDSYNQSGDLP